MVSFKQFQSLDQTLQVDEFRIHYAVDGPDGLRDLSDSNQSGVPDRIDDLARQLVVARRLYTEVLGLTHPLEQARYKNAESIAVLVLRMKSGNGAAFDEVIGGSAERPCMIKMHISRDIRPDRNVTPAHELFHLYQYGYSMFKSSWYLEGMARWVESLFKGGRHLAPEAPPGGAAVCTEVFAESYSAFRYWAKKSRSMRPQPVDIPRTLRSVTYSDGSPVVTALTFPGGAFLLPMMEALRSSSARVSRERRLPTHDWPERLQRSSEFDAEICLAIETAASSL